MALLKLLPQLISVVLISTPALSIAAECSAKSGLQTVPLLELYTSEGCSSCPPADKWLSGLKVDASKVTPLAFHVDYWDYIGWKDRFAKAEYSDRQRKTADLGNSSYVYTPQFVLNGRDFRGVGSDSRFNSALESQLKQMARANLKLDAISEADGTITLKANAEAAAKHADVFIALYENKLVSQVKAGENSGSTLKHDYVVRELFGAYPVSGQFSKNFTLKPEWKNKDAGAVIFVQDSSNGEILQSLQLKFCS
ncbi:MAG: DUF1223 domain-containing protein [Methylophilaceae bacterium]